ncbi:hypothetical protein ACOMHN_037803 [Nucella lapillus]
MDRREARSGKSIGRSQQNIPATNSRTDLLSKEEEYKRLNDELEARTATLVQEAEQVMKGQESILAKSRLLDNINTEDFLKEFDDELTERNEDRTHRPLSRPGSKVSQREGSTVSSGRPKSGKKKPSSARPPSRPKSKASAVEDVAVAGDVTFMTEFKDAFSYQGAFADIEGQMEGDAGVKVDDDDDDDVLPQAAGDMGSEATIRFLKAKVRVMQEELDRLSQDCNKKEEERSGLSGRVKELEDERGRLHRTNAAQQTQMDKFRRLADEARGKSDSQETQLSALRKQTQMDKFRRLADEARGKSDSQETQLSALRKELEQLKRGQKQQQTTQSATEVRLNRALEEIERYREQLTKAKSSSKDSADSEKKRVDQLMGENRRLEKQKNELMAGFKKQMKLIDVLKRQKMHTEAAKMLQFSEEEFVKALEWGS